MHNENLSQKKKKNSDSFLTTTIWLIISLRYVRFKIPQIQEVLKISLRAVEMAQWAKTLATKAGDLGVSPGSHVVEWENQLWQAVL